MCGLFISPWVLAALGKTDYGLCGVVGGTMVVVLAAAELIRPTAILRIPSECPNCDLCN